MSEAARWRQKARAFEQRENWKRAIEAYEAAIQEDKKARRDTDLSLYNRVGDLYRRIGDVNAAVQFWEAAADGHISAGFYNNAIALCNKVLRNQPNRHSIYLKLGKIGAAKGFLSDARKHFLEYAERMQKADRLDKAFSALIEFADISPDPEIRILIADQLLDHDRSGSAIEQLRLAWRDLGAEGREAEAEDVRARIVELNPNRDPEVDPPEAGTSTGYEDAVGVIDLPELEPLPLVEPEGEVEDEADLELHSAGFAEEEGADDEVTAEDLIGIMPTSLTPQDREDEEELEDEEAIVSPDESLEIVPTMLDQEPEDEPAAAGDAQEDSFLSALDPTTSPSAADEELDLADSLELVDEAEEATVEETDDIDVAGLFDEPELEAPELAGPEFEVPELESPDLAGLEMGGLAVPVPEPAVVRVAELQSRLEAEGEKPELLVELADALLERGDREPAIECLREALDVYDEQGDLEGAGRVISELLQLDINDIGAHQKRVELALRAKDPARLIDAYLDLADCLDRTEAGDKARAVYSRVLEMDPHNARARAALDLLGDESKAIEMPAAAQAGKGAAAADFVDLSSLVKEEEAAGKSTRFTVPAVEPQSEGEVNFSEMLSQFKSKVAEAIEEEDAASHYDLGVAYKEMGLLDEAIAEFQIAARGMEYRLRAVEMLGSCFLEKGEYGIALKVLNRALQGQYRDEELVGIFYAMGLAFQELGEGSRALDFYERVMGCDMNFADVADRVAALRQ